MTDRTTPRNAPVPGTPPDDLVQRYHAASTEDGSPHGPSPEASARVLAYAREQAAMRAASDTQPILTPAPDTGASFDGEPANDRRWLRHALGSLAAIGLVGWLTLHHLDEPGAPQLDSPAPASSPAGESAATVSSAASTEPLAADAIANGKASANLGEKSLPAPAPNAPLAIKPEAKKTAEHPLPPAASAPDTAQPGGDGGAAFARKAQQHAPASADMHSATVAPPHAATAPALPTAAMPAPAAPVAATPPPQLDRRARAKEAEFSAGAHAQASVDASAAAERTAEAAAPVSAEHRTATSKAKPLPYCDPAMPADAQAEQARHIQAREEAEAAGKAIPEPAPVCRPPRKSTAPQTIPLDSR